MAWRPEPESVDASQVQAGVVSVVGEVVEGVPGVVGPVVSTTTVELAEYEDSLDTASKALTLA